MVLVVDYVLALRCLCFNVRIKHKVNMWIWSCFIFCIKSFIPVILKTFLNCFSQFHELDGLENSVLHPGDSVVRVQKLIQTPMVWIGSGGLIRVGDCPDMLKEIKGRKCFHCTYCSSYSTMYFNGWICTASCRDDAWELMTGCFLARSTRDIFCSVMALSNHRMYFTYLSLTCSCWLCV